ncbi:ComEC/Rec2 family competence protein [Paenibacillus urinalis]|uniref:ComEC/Rec2 family competence protein n=1 Tax=Paenibacillus urinalis TaxID=521520 RepID=A0AAX3MVH2_9BACL|nr:ComEC/Rec2 family competence protein [Paenibacillus urinalis]WDH81618.1 ComEC/Rec2 family competence protein [Paenibacillus urinalis]
MKGRPLALFCACWIVGSSAAHLYDGLRRYAIVLGVILFLGILFYFTEIRGMLLTVLMTSIVLSCTYYEWNDLKNVTELPAYMEQAEGEVPGMTVELQGTIASKVEVDGDRVQFVLLAHKAREIGALDPNLQSSAETGTDEGAEVITDGEGAYGGRNKGSVKKENDVPTEAAPILNEKIQVQIRLLEEQEQTIADAWQRGDTLTMTGTLEAPGEARNYGSFDYRTYLHTQQIHWLVKAKGIDSIEHDLLDTLFDRHVILRWSDAAREELGGRMEAMFEEPHAGYMKGLVIGIGDEIDPDTYGEFSQLGLTHILAISGMHVAIYVSALLFVLSKCRLSKETALTITLFLVPVYVLISGSSPSVVRAGIMSMIGLYMARRGLMKDGLNILCLTALIMLLVEPYMLVNVSFQLSFLVTAGLMIFVPLLTPHFAKWPKILSGTAVVTIAAQLLSFPMTVYYFNQFSLLSFGANFLLVGFISFLVLPLGTLALALVYLWEPATKPIVWITEWLNSLTFDFVAWLNTFEQFVLIWATPHFMAVAAYYLVLYIIFLLLKKWRISRQPLTPRDEDTIPLTADHMIHSRGQQAVGIMPRKPGAFFLRGETRLQGAIDALQISSAWPELESVFGPQGAGYYARAPFHFFHKVLLAGLCVILSAGLFISYQGPYRASEGIVAVLDVGQGDSILISTPAGKHILVDGGGTIQFGEQEDWKQRRDPYEVGESLLVPLLKKRGIQQLDAVILSHGDHDHAGGLQAVLEDIPVSTFMFNGRMTDKDAFHELLQTALDKGVRLYEAYDGMVYEPDKDTRLTFMAPEAPPEEIHSETDDKKPLPVSEEQNHDSVVFKLDMEHRSFLFTGDIDAAAELDILDRLRRQSEPGSHEDTAHKRDAGEHSIASSEGDMEAKAQTKQQPPPPPQLVSQVDVLKVAHHGSKTSTTEEWLAYWQPQLSVISAGVNNTYGHPHPTVTDRLDQYGSEIYRTDTMGEVQIRVRDGVMEIRSKLGED